MGQQDPGASFNPDFIDSVFHGGEEYNGMESKYCSKLIAYISALVDVKKILEAHEVYVDFSREK
jgi:hypothetical protein